MVRVSKPKFISAGVGFLFALTFLLFQHSGLLARLLSPLTKESSLYASTVTGLLVLTYVLPCFAILSGVMGALVSCKGQRFAAAAIAFFSFLLLVGCAEFFAFEFRKMSLAAELQSQQLKAMQHPSQESQSLPLLDKARPITIANQLESKSELSITPHSTFRVKVYARDQVLLADGTLTAHIFVFKPGTTERKVLAETKLHRTENHSADGRAIFEGEMMIEDTFGASFGILTVLGDLNIADSVNVRVDSD